MTLIAAGKVAGRAAMRGGSGGGDRNENGDCRRVAASIATIQTAQ